MNKFGHINVSKRLSLDMGKMERFCFLLGSILPDILVHTYIVGHKWDSTIEKNCKRLKHLENWGRHSCFSYLKLGYVLHYVEDYFTYPHNLIYKDNMKEHIKYEKAMAKHLKSLNDEPIPSENVRLSAAQLRSWLHKTHEEYINESVHNQETDCKYITRASKMVADSMVAAFARNENKELDLGMEIGLDLEMELDLDLDVEFGLPINERV